MIANFECAEGTLQKGARQHRLLRSFSGMALSRVSRWAEKQDLRPRLSADEDQESVEDHMTVPEHLVHIREKRRFHKLGGVVLGPVMCRLWARWRYFDKKWVTRKPRNPLNLRGCGGWI